MAVLMSANGGNINVSANWDQVQVALLPHPPEGFLARLRVWRRTNSYQRRDHGKLGLRLH